MNDTPCHVHVSIFTKCGKWSVTRVGFTTLESIHTASQELLGSTVKEFRKKVTTDTIDAGSVSVGSLRLGSPCPSNGYPVLDGLSQLRDDTTSDFHRLYEEILGLRNDMNKEYGELCQRINFIDDVLKSNDIRMKDMCKPWTLGNFKYVSK